MAVPKKGWRKISVANTQFFWRATGTDSGIQVVIVAAPAFDRGRKAQQLFFQIAYDNRGTSFHTPNGTGQSLRLQAVVAPGVVRFAIEQALDARPPFTGEVGLPDVSLPKKALIEAQRLASANADDEP